MTKRFRLMLDLWLNQDSNIQTCAVQLDECFLFGGG